MKNIIILLLSIIINGNYVYAKNKFEFTPVNMSFDLVEAQNNVVTAYGTFGSMLISYDNAINWEQIRVFEKGGIVRMFLDNERITAFSDCGEIGISNDTGKTWQSFQGINDSVYAVITYPNGYFVRAKNNLMIFTDNFKEINRYPLCYSPAWIEHGYSNSITFFNGQLIAEVDSSVTEGYVNSTFFLRFDDNLKFVDTISPKKLRLCANCYGSYRITSDSNYFYNVVEKKIYRTNNFKIWEKIQSINDYFARFKIINNKFYFIEVGWYAVSTLVVSLNQLNYPDSTKKVTGFRNTQISDRRRIKDFIVHNGKVIFAGQNKLLIVMPLSDTVFSYYSDKNLNSTYAIPDKVKDSVYLFTGATYQGYYSNYVYKTDNNGLTFQPTIDPFNNADFLKFETFLFKHYDSKEKLLYYAGTMDAFTELEPGAFISSDLGKTFNYIKTPMSNNSNPKSNRFPNIQKNNDNFILTANGTNFIKDYTFTRTYNKKFEEISFFRDSNMVINYLNSNDTNTFLFHCLNSLDSAYEIKYTTNKGLNWEIIKKYNKNDSLLYYKEIEINFIKYLFVVNFRKTDSVCTIDAMDLENRNVGTIYETKAIYRKDGKTRFFVDETISICSDSNTVYISNNDTLFYTKNLYDKSKWEYYLFPYNGKIKRTFSKFGDRFYAWYVDDIHPFNNYWFKLVPDTLSVVEAKIEEVPYLYFFPPYPLPAVKGNVRAMIYWEPKIDIDNDEIIVTNIYGGKVSGRENITIDKKTAYSGYLVWDCSKVETGIYFINLRHGSTSRTLKVIVD